LHVRVAPGASGTGVIGRHGDAWKIRVAAAPERGRANDALTRLLADTLAVPRASVRVVSGHGGRDKIVELAGITAADAERNLASAARRESQ
jgi:uncharacterized protein YggU (UPF0235/DUF167 family)